MNIATGKEVQQRRIDNTIERFEKTAAFTEELERRLSSFADRVVGTRPKNEELANAPKPVPNGTIQRLDEIEARLGNTLQRINSELSELESAL